MPYLTTTHLRLLVVAALALAVAVVAALMAVEAVTAHAAIGEHITNWAGYRRP